MERGVRKPAWAVFSHLLYWVVTALEGKETVILEDNQLYKLFLNSLTQNRPNLVNSTSISRYFFIEV